MSPGAATPQAVRAHNRDAWDRLARTGCVWTRPLPPSAIRDARRGRWEIRLTPHRAIPREWFPPLEGRNVLCLAAGGGHQGPLLAAAGARVTVLDNSPRQLAKDRFVARRDGLAIETVLGDMADLSGFARGSFDLVVHPCSNCYVPDVHPVWKESFRVLARGGVLLAGFVNPVRFLFGTDGPPRGRRLVVTNRIPHATRRAKAGSVVEFGHTLADQIGGQIAAGFAITGFLENGYRGGRDPLSGHIDSFIATRAVKPGR